MSNSIILVYFRLGVTAKEKMTVQNILKNRSLLSIIN